MEKWFTAQQLADLALKSLPHTKAGVIYRAKKDDWKNRKRSAKGGGLEYAFDGLPADVQAEIKAKQIRAMLPKAEKPSIPALLERDLGDLTHEQRATADARLLMALLVMQFDVGLGGRTKSLEYVSELSRNNALPTIDGTDYNQVCTTALAKKSRTGSKVGVGVRKLHDWCMLAEQCETAEQRLKMFAPQKQGHPETQPIYMAWLPDFMAVYRNTNGMNISEAYRVFATSYGYKHGQQAVPSLAVVRSALSKMPKFVREKGRVTGSHYRSLLTYVKRDWNTSWFMNNDVWVGDGHSLKMKVQHPEHGRPFTPELTIIMDAPSRYVVGWSLSYSESTFAVADALRHGMIHHGIPAIYYSDNGSGQTNNTLDADLTGILPRLGVHHETGIAGNPQGRGIIERFMKVVPRWIAQQFETSYVTGADRETVRKTLVAVDSLAKAQQQHKAEHELTPVQKSAKGKLPTWSELFAVIEQAIDFYNNHWEHSSIGTTPQAMRNALAKRMEQDGLEIVPLTEVEARDLFRPAFKRRVQRAWLQLFNMSYWHKALEPLDGQDVICYIDQHDPSSIIIRDLNGSYICDAILDGNKHDAFPKSLVEMKREQRANQRLKKLDDEARKARAELQPTLTIAYDETLGDLIDVQPKVIEHDEELVMFACDKKAI